MKLFEIRISVCAMDEEKLRAAVSEMIERLKGNDGAVIDVLNVELNSAWRETELAGQENPSALTMSNQEIIEQPLDW